jgi:hypothetical protein
MATLTCKFYWTASQVLEGSAVARLYSVDTNSTFNFVVAKIFYNNPYYSVEFNPLSSELSDARSIQFESLHDAKMYAQTTYLLTRRENHGTKSHPPQRQSNAGQANRT